MRGKRGLNHVHVGSLHAADDEMALRHARDVYTRRNEGVSIWVVLADGHHRVEPGREGPAVRAQRRQGLPAPDVLRDPRRRPAHVSAARCHRPRLTPMHGSVYDGLLGDADPSQWAFGTDFEDPLAGVDTDRAGRRGPCRPRGVLPDARRRRARAVPPAVRVVQPRAGPGGGHRAGQHRARPARPGPAAAGPGRGGRPVRRARPARGLAGAARTRWPSSARRSEFRNVRLVEVRRTATSRDASCGCCCSRRTGWPCWSG